MPPKSSGVKPRASHPPAVDVSCGQLAEFECSEEGFLQLVSAFRGGAASPRLSSGAAPPPLVSGDVLLSILDMADVKLRSCPNVVSVTVPPAPDGLTVVGDLHGQFFDLLRIFDRNGQVGPDRPYVFLGDYVDRGSFGLETFFTLLACYLRFPRHVVLLRGNHETLDMSSANGFRDEVTDKYSPQLFERIVKTFGLLPLAALATGRVGRVERRALFLHGGLFRASDSCDGEIGSVGGLRKLNRFCENPRWGSAVEDVLWSDPRETNGVCENEMRGAGLMWGPDVSERFLKSNKLCLVVRAHEGPDARIRRPEMTGTMMSGWSVDHCGQSGRVVTLFSAADYPQGQERGNRGAFLTISADLQLRFVEFRGAPHPPARLYFTPPASPIF